MEIAELKAAIASKDGDIKAQLMEKAMERQQAVAEKDAEIAKLKADFTSRIKAAEQGLARAQYGMGESYYSGEGVAEDKEKAKEWFRKAAENGNEEAAEALKKHFSNRQQ